MPELRLNDLAVRPAGLNAADVRFLIDDLKDAERDLEHDGTIRFAVAQTIEAKILRLLDSISPAVCNVLADYERYRAMPKIGGR